MKFTEERTFESEWELRVRRGEPWPYCAIHLPSGARLYSRDGAEWFHDNGAPSVVLGRDAERIARGLEIARTWKDEL
jgi:hypothetical protein